MEFKCSVCDYTSEYKAHIKRHLAKCEGATIVEIKIDIVCEKCGKSYATQYNLRRHFKMCKIDKNETDDKSDNEDNGVKIPLKNKQGVVTYTIIDEEDYDKVIEHKWHLTENGYVESKIGKLHRFIMNAKTGDQFIDHINGNKLDNRKINLRFVSQSQNMQNIRKIEDGASSKYKGVSLNKKAKTWKCRIICNSKATSFTFKKEDHAAYWYDCLAVELFGAEAKINNVEKPVDFVEPDRNRKQREIKKIIKPTIQKPIVRNKEGIAIIFTSKNEEILVNDDKYYDLIQYSWYLNNYGYPVASINKKSILMHRYLLNPAKDKIIDHINHNRQDSRIENLRISDPCLNSHNKPKQKDGTSKYIGVSTFGGKIVAKIQKDKKSYYLGSFKTEEDAAEAYNKKATELYGDHANLNTL